MVRLGEFEMLVVRPKGGGAFPEVTGRDGKVYVVAAPGEPFEVQFTRHHSGADPPKGSHYTAHLTVDGVTVGYSKNIVAPGTTRFEGFLKAGDAEGMAVRGFVFSKPQETQAKQAQSLNFTEGTIRCKVCLAQYTGEVINTRHLGPASTNETIPQLPEGKKFFMAPSLTTGQGELKMLSGFSTRQVRFLNPDHPTAVLEVRYETAATLLLRGVLQREDPAHRAILQQFPETAEEEEGQQAAHNDDEAGPSRAAASVVGQGCKRPRGERSQPRRRQQQRQEDVLIDLTQAVNEDDEVLAAKRADQVLECDLTRDAAAPAWRAVKKEVHDVM